MCQQEPSYVPAVLLRGIISNFFSVPPSFASLLALSLAISASRPFHLKITNQDATPNIPPNKAFSMAKWHMKTA